MSSGTQSIDRAAAVLRYVVTAEGRVSFTQVVAQTGLSRSTASRLLSALERNGLVERDADGGYRGGALFASYAARFDRLESLADAAGPTLERISEETGETVNLAVPSGEKVVQIAQIDATFMLGATNWVDIDVPPHCSALGKALYAAGAIPVPDGPLERRTEATLADRGALLADLEQTRRRGYAIAQQELEDGLDAVAAVVTGPDDAVVAAIGVSGPTSRLAGDHERIGRLIVHEADTLSRALRHRVHAAHLPR